MRAKLAINLFLVAFAATAVIHSYQKHNVDAAAVEMAQTADDCRYTSYVVRGGWDAGPGDAWGFMATHPQTNCCSKILAEAGYVNLTGSTQHLVLGMRAVDINNPNNVVWGPVYSPVTSVPNSSLELIQVDNYDSTFPFCDVLVQCQLEIAATVFGNPLFVPYVDLEGPCTWDRMWMKCDGDTCQ